MAAIDISSTGGGTLDTGILQLENGVALDSTLRTVTDQNNTLSTLNLSTDSAQFTSPLRITTDDPSDFYLDCEDGSTNNRFNITRNTASQQVNLNFASNPAGSTTTVGAIRTFTDGVNLGEVVKFREDGQVTFTERVNVEADSLVTTESCSVIAASTTNTNLVIAPNGTGGLIASIPDGTATGGNARGSNAVDLQTSRTNAQNVASGDYSVVTGGINNRANSTGSFVGGGSNNSTTGLDDYQAIVGGQSNSISQSGGSFIGGGLSNSVNTSAGTGYCVISGGRSNSITSSYSVVSGGQSNTASTGSHAMVVGGQSNTASGQYSVAGGFLNTVSGYGSIALGSNNIATTTSAKIGTSNIGSAADAYAFGASNSNTGSENTYNFGLGNSCSHFTTMAIGFSNSVGRNNSIAIGTSNTVSNSSFSTILGGRSNLASSAIEDKYITIVGGLQCLGYQYGSISSASGRFSTTGDTQVSQLIARREATLTTGGTTVLSLDGTGVTNLIIPDGNNRMWNVQVRWVAVVTAITGTATGVTVGDTKTSTDLLAVAKRAGTTTVSAHTSAGTHAIETIAGSLTAVNIAYTAGASQEMAITFTGPTFAGGGSVTMRVVAAISLTEVAY